MKGPPLPLRPAGPARSRHIAAALPLALVLSATAVHVRRAAALTLAVVLAPASVLGRLGRRRGGRDARRHRTLGLAAAERARPSAKANHSSAHQGVSRIHDPCVKTITAVAIARHRSAEPGSRRCSGDRRAFPDSPDGWQPALASDRRATGGECRPRRTVRCPRSPIPWFSLLALSCAWSCGTAGGDPQTPPYTDEPAFQGEVDAGGATTAPTPVDIDPEPAPAGQRAGRDAGRGGRGRGRIGRQQRAVPRVRRHDAEGAAGARRRLLRPRRLRVDERPRRRSEVEVERGRGGHDRLGGGSGDPSA